jgi:hypothetical protein
MKRIILLVLLFSVSLLSCKKEPKAEAEFNGEIIGADPTMCGCCGGYFINIENTVYRFDSLPPNNGIDLTSLKGKYITPIYVVVSWHKGNKPCIGGDFIIIDKIRKK